MFVKRVMPPAMETCDHQKVLHETNSFIGKKYGNLTCCSCRQSTAENSRLAPWKSYCEQGGMPEEQCKFVHRDQHCKCCSSCADRKNSDERGKSPCTRCFIDLQKAYDFADRELLTAMWEVLARFTGQDGSSYPPVPRRHAGSRAYGRRLALRMVWRDAGSSAGLRGCVLSPL